jgi:L-ascorbate metabolism protein UlaG (beta-lactamase superfamily)
VTDRTVYIDPWGVGDDDAPADLILITHAHADHFDRDDIAKVTGPRTKLVAPYDVAKELSGDVTAVAPASRTRSPASGSRPCPRTTSSRNASRSIRARSGGWASCWSFGSHSYYHAGDTDHLLELESLEADVAFLPIARDVHDGRRAGGRPRACDRTGVAVPMHYGFVVGQRGATERGSGNAASPVPVEILTPVRPFEC